MRRRVPIATVLTIVAVAFLSVLFRGSSARPAGLGAPGGVLAPCPPTPNCVSTQAPDARHRAAPLPFSGSAAEAMRRLRDAVASMRGARVVEERDGYLYAEFTSRVFRFVDDVELVVDPAARLVHYRSASRVGRSDFGVNRRRMEAIAARFAASAPR